MAGALGKVAQAGVKAVFSKTGQEAAEQVASKAAKALPEALSKASKSVGDKLTLLADSLPTGNLTLGAKQAGAMENLAAILHSKDGVNVFGAIKELLTKGEGRHIIAISREATEGAAKELEFVVREGEKTLAKVEANSSFLSQLGETIKTISTRSREISKFSELEKMLSPSEFAKLSEAYNAGKMPNLSLDAIKAVAGIQGDKLESAWRILNRA